jgi:2-polyprenyl-6-methoxyphenol hydroxylase-like FAD-dependent oxidoreductase
MKVLISGAGIAGSSLAFWLTHLGHTVTVLERFPTLRTSGLQIDLRGPGVTVLKLMGLSEQFLAQRAQEQGLQFVDSSGRCRAFFPANMSGIGDQNFTAEYEIMRGDFCRLLYIATKERTTYIFGTRIQRYESHDNGVEVHFSNGDTASYDLVVGADGQGSRTRKMMLGSDTADGFVPLKDIVAYFTLPWPVQPGEEYVATIYMAPGDRGIMTRRHDPDKIQVYLGGTAASKQLANIRPGDVEAQKKVLKECLKGAGWRIDEVLDSLGQTDDFYCERLGLVKLDTWHRGRVALLGDAAYCSSVNTGMGTTSAVVGAYILAGEIGRHCRGRDEDGDGLELALKAYEDKFMPFTTQLQSAVSTEESMWEKVFSTRVGIELLNVMVGAASLFKVNIARFMLKGDVKGWELPEYEELTRERRAVAVGRREV